MKTAFMFPGQGSQTVGMMSQLLEESVKAKQVFERATDAIGLDLAALAIDGPEDKINQTEITQPLVLTASLAVWEALCELTDKRPDFVLGHSLGEYTALVASGVMALEDAVKLVHLRGQLMQGAVPLGQGAMAALLGLEDEVVVDVCARASQGEVVSAANFNSPGQVVISGANAALERAIDLAKNEGARRAAMLPVSVPCHCSLLAPAGQELAEAINNTAMQAPTIPVIQNFTASVPADLDEMKANLVEHLHQAVQWSDSIRYAVAQGCTTFVECGPGKVLSGLGRRIDKSTRAVPISDRAGIDEFISEWLE